MLYDYVRPIIRRSGLVPRHLHAEERLVGNVDTFASLLLRHLVEQRLVKAAGRGLLEVKLPFKRHYGYL